MRYLELDEVLKYIQDNAADREVWDMADQGWYIVLSYVAITKNI